MPPVPRAVTVAMACLAAFVPDHTTGRVTSPHTPTPTPRPSRRGCSECRPAAALALTTFASLSLMDTAMPVDRLGSRGGGSASDGILKHTNYVYSVHKAGAVFVSVLVSSVATAAV